MLPDTPIQLLEADIVDDSKLLVYFSDGTMAEFSADDLLACAPKRVKVEASVVGR